MTTEIPAVDQVDSETPPQSESVNDQQKMSYAEFLVWADEDTLAEWVDGEVVMYSPASKKHQELARFLNGLLSFFANAKDLGEVLFAPFQVKLGPDLPGREPDLLFIASEHLDRLKANYLDGPADLIVEIISPSSRERDRGQKFYEYEEAGVSEYWLIDAQRRQAEFYQLSEQGIYHHVHADTEGVYHANILPGFWLRVDWLWREPLPSPMETIRLLTEILGDDPGAAALGALTEAT
jgi:Uma2 family endonuclease